MNGEARSGGGVLICFAVKEEAQPFLQTAASQRAKILITGIGGNNAERGLRESFETGLPEIVLSCGFAGGLNPQIANGEVVFSTDLNFPLQTHLRASGAKQGAFYCAKRIVTSTMEKAALRSQTGADAVEMESEVIRRICTERKLPSATVRVISDAANEDLPMDFNQFMTAEYKLSLCRLISVMLLKPWKIPALIRFEKKTKAAAKNLSRVLESLPI